MEQYRNRRGQGGRNPAGVLDPDPGVIPKANKYEFEFPPPKRKLDRVVRSYICLTASRAPGKVDFLAGLCAWKNEVLYTSTVFIFSSFDMIWCLILCPLRRFFN